MFNKILFNPGWKKKQSIYNYFYCFRTDIKEGKLGSKPTRELLDELKPKYWFSAHLHCKFAAIVNHTSDDNVIIFDVFLKNLLYKLQTHITWKQLNCVF